MLHSRPVWARTGCRAQPHALCAPNFRIVLCYSDRARTQQVHCSASAPSMAACESSLQHNPHDPHKHPMSVIRRIRETLATGEKSAVDITQDYLAKLHKREPHIRSFLHVSEKALQDAQELDKRIADGGDVGPLGGVPLAVKDNLCTRDMPSTGGSYILRSYIPPFDATAVSKLRSSGAVLVGKTNMDEFGMGSSTEGSAYQVILITAQFQFSYDLMGFAPVHHLKI